jgi:uncharacterized protein
VREVFVDTWFWVARADKRDQHHQAALTAQRRLGKARLITTDEVLVEFLAALSGYGAAIRMAAARTVRQLLEGEEVEVLPQSRESFLGGLDLYESRRDKEYSLTDCISMQTMQRRGLTEILTLDHHFAQEGFILVARP